MADFYLDYRGSDYNGGGYDSTITGATVNLASGQYAALTASGLECTAGSTTVTSVHGGFTTDMIGNTINIYNGNDFNYKFYFISGVPDANTLQLDEVAAASNVVSGVGKIGGAWRCTLISLLTEVEVDLTGREKISTTGDIVHIRGNGEQNPVSGQYLTFAWVSL